MGYWLIGIGVAIVWTLSIVATRRLDRKHFPEMAATDKWLFACLAPLGPVLLLILYSQIKDMEAAKAKREGG